MNPSVNKLLRALPHSHRTVSIVAYEVFSATQVAEAQTSYLSALGNTNDSGDLPSAPRTSRPIFSDDSGALFTVHDSEDGPVTLPANARPALRHDPTASDNGGFIQSHDVEAMHGDAATLYNSDSVLYPAAAETSSVPLTACMALC